MSNTSYDTSPAGVRNPDREKLISSQKVRYSRNRGRRIVKHSGVKPLTRLVVLCLIDRMNEETGWSSVTYDVLHEDTGMCLDAMSNHIKLAEAAGLIKVTRPSKRDAMERKKPNRYLLVCAQADPRPLSGVVRETETPYGLALPERQAEAGSKTSETEKKVSVSFAAGEDQNQNRHQEEKTTIGDYDILPDNRTVRSVHGDLWCETCGELLTEHCYVTRHPYHCWGCNGRVAEPTDVGDKIRYDCVNLKCPQRSRDLPASTGKVNP